LMIENQLTKHKYSQFQKILEIVPQERKKDLKNLLKRTGNQQAKMMTKMNK